MKKLKGFSKSYGWLRDPVIIWLVLALATLAWLLLYKLGSLTGDLSIGEVNTAVAPVGWHGIFRAPLDLPLKLVRSIVYFLAPGHGQTLTRLPNVFFGGLAVTSFAWLIWLWHGTRTAILTLLLFASSAWVLHVSRLASFDVMYLCVVPLLLIAQALLYRGSDKPAIWYGSLIIWLFLLYLPGVLWLVGLHLFLQRKMLTKIWRETGTARRRLVSLVVIVIGLPLLIWDLTRAGQFREWIGLPTHFAPILTVIKHFFGVFVHLFIRGPQYPDRWLGRAPILDVFTLVIAALGIYFYAQHWRAWRSRTLGMMFGVGVILVTLGGPVGLSLLVPLLYVAAAAGLAYLLHEWLQVFPLNPLARGLGIGIMAVLVCLSCLYNLRSYFIAWPHNQTTQAIFRYHR